MRIEGRTIRNERYRYTEWDKGVHGFELYDYETDPLEFANLANDKKYREIVDEMFRKLRASYE